MGFDSFGKGIPLLLLPGLSLDRKHMIYELEPILSQRAGWRRLYVDLPGHGDSPASKSLRSMDDVLALLLRFIEKTIGADRFVIAGTSYGAYMARGVVHAMANRIDGLLMTVPAVLYPRSDRRPAPRHLISTDAAVRQAAVTEGRSWYLDMAVAEIPGSLEYARVADASIHDEAFLVEITNGSPCRFQGERLASPFAAPTLIVTGRQDNVVGYEDAWDILEDYPRATFAVLDRAGHMAGGEQPTLMAALIHEWLTRVEEWISQR